MNKTDILNKAAETCGIHFNRDDFKDESGCIKPIGHNDKHSCITSNGNLMEWEYDYNCQCGCWGEGDDFYSVCIVYSEIKI